MRDAGYELSWHPRDSDRTPDELAELAAQARSPSIADADPFDASVLKRAPKLRVIARMGVGLDSIDLAAATAAGRRGHYHAERQQRNRRRWRAGADPGHRFGESSNRTRSSAPVGGGSFGERGGSWQLHRATVGIVGYGAIGRAVGQRLLGFGANVIVHDPLLSEADLPLVSLDELVAASSDVVTIHSPLTDETRGTVLGAS